MEIKVQDYEKMSKEELVYILKNLKYGLIWSVNENTKEQFEKESGNAYPVLKGVPERDILTDKEKPTNLLIEGDNYHVLSVMQYTHRNSIDVIYIDPPYNTGNKDFVYNDRFVDKEDTWRHSKWLSFMNKRLRLARELLKDDGVIFISIDDNEQAQLKLLCDEVFGEENFISNLAIENNPKGRKNSLFISGSYEYCLVYAKNRQFYSKNKKKFNLISINNKKDKRPIFKDENGKYKKGKRQVIGNNSNPLAKHNPKRGFTIYYNKDINKLEIVNEYDKVADKFILSKYGEELIKTGYKRYLGYNKKLKKPNQVTYTEEKIKELHENNDLIFLENSIYQKERNFKQRLKSLITKENIGLDILTETAGRKLKEILPNHNFSFPKPVDLIKLFVSLHPNKDAVVLDFFAGSGTTGHAVLDLNKEDGGNRQFILVTNNENNICTDVCYPRIKKVIEGYTTPKGKKIEGLGGNLKYYKTDFVPKNANTDQLMSDLVKKCTDILCIKENTFDLVSDTRPYKIFKSPQKVMAVYTSVPSYANFQKLNDELTRFDGKKILYCFTFNPLGIDEEHLEMLNILKDVEVEPIPHQLKNMLDEALKKG